MSRTYKDRPRKLKFVPYDKDTERVPYVCSYVSVYTQEENSYSTFYTVYLPTTKPKKRKTKNTEDHWMSTPSWWTRLTMTVPERRSNRIQERKALFSDIEEFDFIDLGRKPHCYFW